jgi:hypothetical protein
MINKKLKILQDKFETLSVSEQKDFDKLLSYLIDLIESDSTNNNIRDITKYLSKKIVREKSENKPLDFSKLRNMLVHGQYKAEYREYEAEYNQKLDKIVWIILPELSYFKNLQNLSNFLGNYLNVNIREDEDIHNMITQQKLKTKEEVINAYRNLYSRFKGEKKMESLRELGRGVLVVATKQELNKFQREYSL